MTISECVNKHQQLVDLHIGESETFPMDELRALYADADQKLFDSAVKLFDWTQKGEKALENVKMFSLLMVALLHPSEEGETDRSQFDIARLPRVRARARRARDVRVRRCHRPSRSSTRTVTA